MKTFQNMTLSLIIFFDLQTWKKGVKMHNNSSSQQSANGWLTFEKQLRNSKPTVCWQKTNCLRTDEKVSYLAPVVQSVNCPLNNSHQSFFSQCVSRWNSTNPTIWLVPGAGRIFPSGLISSGGMVACWVVIARKCFKFVWKPFEWPFLLQK